MVTPLSIKWCIANRPPRIAAAHPIEAWKYLTPNRQRKLAQSARLQFDRDQNLPICDKTRFISITWGRRLQLRARRRTPLPAAPQRGVAGLAA
jgi:hypothetical protein